jgi:hypothetical protein
LLAEDPVRAVRVVVVGIFAEAVVEMSPARNENAVSALAAGAGDPPLADRVRARFLDGRFDYPHAGRGETASNALVYFAIPVSDQDFRPLVHSPRSMSAFRVCCTVQAAAGRAKPNEDQVKKTEGHES